MSAPEDRTGDRAQADADHAVTVDRLDRLIEASDRQAESNRQLAIATVEYQERAKVAARRFRITMVALGVVLIVVLGAIWVDLNSGRSIRGTLLDCVQPSGHCYQRGQQRTAELVGNLNQVTALAAACAPDYVDLPLPKRIVAIEACIKRGMN